MKQLSTYIHIYRTCAAFIELLIKFIMKKSIFVIKKNSKFESGDLNLYRRNSRLMS